MCTALSFAAADHYFGRTLDLACSYGEGVTILPRRFPLSFGGAGIITDHPAIIGMAVMFEDIPLFYDGVNEHGLAMAGLNFPGNARYAAPVPGRDNVPSHAFIPWILCQCRDVEEAKTLLARLNITGETFSKRVPSAPLHWMIADATECVVVEMMEDGLHVYQNPAGVLTNNPPFPYHLENLEKYSHLRTDNVGVVRQEGLGYDAHCQGLGAVGLPGDVSSRSRFVRAAFGRRHAVKPQDETAAVGQFFHLLSSVEMVKGLCLTDEGNYDITVYTSCMNTAKGIYYYTTYGNRRITAVDMHGADLDGDGVARFPLVKDEDILGQN